MSGGADVDVIESATGADGAPCPCGSGVPESGRRHALNPMRVERAPDSGGSPHASVP
jgi:hypothetical protein